MFLKARQWLRLMLFSLVVQIGNLAKVGKRKGYEGKYRDDFEPRPESKLNGPSRLPLEDPSNYQLSLTGKLEPASHLPTVKLFGNSHTEDPWLSGSRRSWCCSGGH